MKNQQKATQVIIVGAGYAGLLATARLAGKVRHQPVSITLVNASDTFIERLRLHEFAANRHLKRRPIIKTLRGTGVKFVQGRVSHIDPSRHVLKVETATGTEHLQYDKLLYALGSVTDRDRVPGVREYAYTLNATGPLSATEMREKLLALGKSGGRLVVCGGGATGIESAAEFAQVYPQIEVHLFTRGQFGQVLGRTVANYMRESLQRLHVTIHENTSVTEVKAGEITTSEGSLAYDICLWAGGFVTPPLARESGLTVNDKGQILIDPYMRSISHPDIFAVGDAAQPLEDPSVKVRMSAFTAVIMGAHGADCLAATLKGKTPKAFSFAYSGQGIALGPRNAIGFGKTPDDIPRGPYFTGRAASGIREFGARFLATLPSIERWWPGFFFWAGKKRYEAMKRERQTAIRVDASL